jgi:Short C-terminal domain
MAKGAVYLGGLSWAPDGGFGELTLSDDTVELVGRKAGTGSAGTKSVVVKIGVPAIECIEVMSEQVAKSKIGPALAFGVLGGLAAKGAADRGTLLVHLKSGQTAYFEISDYSTHQILAKLTPWIQSVGVRVGPREAAAVPAQTTISVADEIAKLGELKTAGLLTEEEFAAQKAKLLS